MKTMYVQSSFSGGEFDKRVMGRIDVPKYPTGLRECENFYIHKFGSVSNRTGFKYLGSAKKANKKTKLVPFVYSDDQAYVMEFGEGYIRFWYSNGSPVTKNGSPVEVATEYTESDLAKIRYCQSADKVFFAVEGRKPKVLTRYSSTSWTFSDIEFRNGPYLSVNLDNQSTITPNTSTGTVNATKDIFKPEHVGTKWKLEQNEAGGTVSLHTLAVKDETIVTTSAKIKCGANTMWRLVTHGDWTGTVKVERSFDDGTTWMQLRSYKHSGAESNYNVYADESEQCYLRMHLTLNKQSDENRFAAELSVDPFVSVGYFTVSAYQSTRQVTITNDTEYPVNNTKTDMWYEPAWSRVQGYPAAITFWEDRLVFAGTKLTPRGIWMSKPADYTNFGIGQYTSEEDDSIQIILSSKKMSIIHSLVSLRQAVIAFSEDGVNTVSYSGNSLTPSSVMQRAESYFGAKNIDPLTVGAQIIYVQEVGGALRDVGYDYVQDAYSGDEISLYAAELVETSPPLEMTYQAEPDSIVWITREDGVLLSMTYMREQKMIAWAHHKTQGEFESVCVIPANNKSRLWAIVKRKVNGNTVRYIERMSNRLPSADPSDQLYMDAAFTYEGEETQRIYAPYLAGKEVGILLDGNIMPDKTVGTDGYLDMERPGKKIAVGLKYTSTLKTLGIEMQGMVRGFMQGHKVKIGEVILRLLSSRGGRVGQDNLDEWQQRLKSDNLGNALALYTGDIRIHSSFEPRENEGITIIQDTAMPFTLLSLIFAVNVSDD